MKPTELLIFPETGFVRIPQILEVIPIGESTWWKWVKSGKAPAPVKLGPRTTAWTAESIRSLITDLKESSPETIDLQDIPRELEDTTADQDGQNG